MANLPEENGFNTDHMKALFKAISNVYPMSFWVNMTTNNCGTLDRERATILGREMSGDFDKTFEGMLRLIPNKETKEKVRNTIGRQALIKAYEAGENLVTMTYQQSAPDGSVHWLNTMVIFVRDIGTDMYNVTLSRIVDREMAIERENEDTKIKANEYQNTLINASSGYMEIDLSSNKIVGDILDVDIDGNFFSVDTKSYGETVPFDQFVFDWANNNLTSNYIDFISKSNCAYLISQYEQGKKLVEISASSIVPGSVDTIRHSKYSYYLSKNERSNKISAFLMVMDETDIVNKENENQRYSHVVTALSESFERVYYININDNTFHRINLKPSSISSNLALEGNDFFESAIKKANEAVYEEDLESYLSFISKENITKSLESSDSLIKDYRINVNGSPRYHRGKITKCANDPDNILYAVEDVDEAVRTQKERDIKFQNALKRSKEKAEAANKAKTAFLANMSHDIRTPLNSIVGCTDIALKNIDTDKEKAIEFIKQSRKSSNYLISLVNDILDITQIEFGEIKLNPKPIDLISACDSVEDMIEVLLENKNRNIRFTKGKFKNRFVLADYTRLNQVIINLISNAIKFTKDGDSININVRQLPETSDNIANYQFTIADTGIGMSKDFIKVIGNSFSQATPTTINEQRGIGVGLTIVKHIVKLAGGTFSVESEPNVGSKFTITVPLEIQQSEEKDEIKIDKKESTLSGKNVLIVEDNSINQMVISEILSSRGIRNEIAENGLIAVNMVKEKGPDYYDEILMDIMMPIMDGYEATIEIRKLFPDKHIPIIALSANSFDEDIKHSLDIGMDDHQCKPIIAARLIEAMEKFI